MADRRGMSLGLVRIAKHLLRIVARMFFDWRASFRERAVHLAARNVRPSRKQVELAYALQCGLG